MKKYLPLACAFYGIGIAGMGLQQFLYADLRPVIISPWPAWMHSATIAYISGAALMAAGVCILLMKKTAVVPFLTGIFLLFFFTSFQVPFLLFVNQYSPWHLGLWTDALKESALAGGAFVIADLSGPISGVSSYNRKDIFAQRRLIFWGSLLFSITMICFGVDHFLYPDFVSKLVPEWLHFPLFWNYFAAIALIGAGAAIILKFKLRLIAQLLALMLFLWLIVLHIPRAITDPHSGSGNEITSVFQALAFSGISLAIAYSARKK